MMWDPICTRTKSTWSVKQISLLEVDRLLPQLRETVRCSGRHLYLLQTSSAACDPEEQAEPEDKAEGWPVAKRPRDGRPRMASSLGVITLSADLVTS